MRTAADWWTGLSRAWRANIGLYGLATIALALLVAQIAVGGNRSPQRVEVASRAPTVTAPSSAGRQTTTTGPTTTLPGPTATGAPATTVARVAPRGPTPAPTPPPPVPLSVDPPKPPAETTVPGPVCRNSTSPQCGPFYWDPTPSRNQALTVNVSASRANPTTADTVTFTVTVTDPDHGVTDNCAEVNWGDSSPVERRGCTRAPCPEIHGPWEPPPAVNGSDTFRFTHRFQQTGSFTPTFTFHTDYDPPCPSPYGSAGSGGTTVTVHQAP